MDQVTGYIISGLVAILTLAFTIVGYFLRKKDEDQEKQIAALWTKHDQDTAALAELKLVIAKEHYLKSELDVKFEKLEKAFTDGMNMLGGKFDKFTGVLFEHVQWEERNKYQQDHSRKE